LPQCRHYRHHPRRVFLFRHAAILPPPLHCIRWTEQRQRHAAIRQRGNQGKRIAADDSVYPERTGLSGHRKESLKWLSGHLKGVMPSFNL
jgi:hypothetical protein